MISAVPISFPAAPDREIVVPMRSNSLCDAHTFAYQQFINPETTYFRDFSWYHGVTESLPWKSDTTVSVKARRQDNIIL